MKLFNFLLILTFSLQQIWLISCETCRQIEQVNEPTKILASDTAGCWIINMIPNSYLRMQIFLDFPEHCNAQLEISISGTSEKYDLCQRSRNMTEIIARGKSVEVHFRKAFYIGGNFTLKYYTVSGVKSIKGVGASLESSTSWLRSQRYPSFGWGINTPRAITALYLSGNMSFPSDNNMENELMDKELELQTAAALLRKLNANELSMFINGLTVACFDIRRFFGKDLLQVLSDKLPLKSPMPGPYLTLCNSNYTLDENATEILLDLLDRKSNFSFATDVQAMSIVALTCIKNRTYHAVTIPNFMSLYNATIEKFIESQHSDGSFGNPHTTAWVVQALIASGQETNETWQLNATVNYLMQQLNSSSVDFLLAYLSLPILKGKSLLDIANIDCTKHRRKDRDDFEDIMNKLNGNMQIQYSLYIGDLKSVIHTIQLLMPDGSSVYDLMKVAQRADPKFRFASKLVSDHEYVFSLSGISNDPETGMFWILYRKSHAANGTTQINESPDRVFLQDRDHVIMWYKTSEI